MFSSGVVNIAFIDYFGVLVPSGAPGDDQHIFSNFGWFVIPWSISFTHLIVEWFDILNGRLILHRFFFYHRLARYLNRLCCFFQWSGKSTLYWIAWSLVCLWSSWWWPTHFERRLIWHTWWSSDSTYLMVDWFFTAFCLYNRLARYLSRLPVFSSGVTNLAYIE